MFESYLYYPDKIPSDVPPPAWTPPGAREVFIEDEDSVRIHGLWWDEPAGRPVIPVSYTHLRAHETPEHLVCRLLLEKKKKTQHSKRFTISSTKQKNNKQKTKNTSISNY